MKRFPIWQIDAFTTQPLGGNPCAVVFDAGRLDENTMLAIAREMNLSETAFIQSTTSAGIAVRFFTPAEEIPLAGHPTIATAYALVVSGRLPLLSEKTSLRLELIEGPILVEIFAQQGKIAQITMFQRKPVFLATYDPTEIMPIFGLEGDDLYHGMIPQTVSTGTPQLMLPLVNLEALRRARLDVHAYRVLRKRGDFFSPHLFCLEGATPTGDTFARHFGVPPDTPEDPFTGSATGGMAAYLWHHGLIESPSFTAEQGHWMNRPGKALVEVVGSPDNIEAVKVSGNAVAVLQGFLTL